jgi:hypothetical protein
MSKITDAGWRFPTPHEVMAALFLIAEGAREADVFEPGSKMIKALALFLTVCAIAGIASAAKRLPERVRSKLEAFEKADGEVSAQPVEKEVTP